MENLTWLVGHRRNGNLNDREFGLLLRLYYRFNGDFENMMDAVEALEVEEVELKDNLTELYDVRIPEKYITMLHKGGITTSMLLTLVVLYKWADWITGKVEACSAKGLQTWTHKAFSDRTFSEALRKLE